MNNCIRMGNLKKRIVALVFTLLILMAMPSFVIWL